MYILRILQVLLTQANLLKHHTSAQINDIAYLRCGQSVTLPITRDPSAIMNVLIW